MNTYKINTIQNPEVVGGWLAQLIEQMTHRLEGPEFNPPPFYYVNTSILKGDWENLHHDKV